MDHEKSTPFSVTCGTPDTLGATADETGVNFAVYSKHATRMELCLFAPDGVTETARIALPFKTGDVFHAHVAGIGAGQLYGLRAEGPNAPHDGHRFDGGKALLDPYAQDIDHTTRKARVASPVVKPPIPPKALDATPALIYELHVKGFTAERADVPEELRGTYAGLASPAAISHLKALGVTAVELMPVHAKQDDDFLTQKGLKNYWGYNTLGFFAPEASYAADKTNARQELRDMVDTLHQNGIAVILDVVYNHTAEGSAQSGPTLSLRGLDNASYYALGAQDKSKDADVTGCGNTLDFTKPAARTLALDSLRHFATEYGVDGFRFDLATVLGREAQGFTAEAAFFKELAADPVLSKLTLIAEPWDAGAGGYHLGAFPKGWQEWNDTFRDDVRKFWRQDNGMLPALATRLAGSSPQFAHNGRAPAASINFVACHDGFTLQDVVSYSAKHNDKNGENNKDGANNNNSANCGAEGDTQDESILARRAQRKRNMLATLFLAQGTPMLLAGDERANSQQGNNNAYCQDNPTGWVKWSAQKEDDAFQRFVEKLMAFRKEHAVLTAPAYLHGKNKDANGVPDISWHNPAGRLQTGDDWARAQDKCIGMLLNERAITQDADKKKAGERLLAVFNAASNPVDFVLPPAQGGGKWERVIDTSAPALGDAAQAGAVYTQKSNTRSAPESPARIAPESVAVFVQKP